MDSISVKSSEVTTKKKGKLKETIESILVALFFALLIRAFVVQAFKIPSGSMEPTLLVGDYLLVTKFTYGYKFPFIKKRVFAFNKPERGDIVVFKYPVDPDKDFIKRVVGVEGDEILIKDKKLYVNGQPFVVEKAVFRDNVVLPKEISPRDNYGPIKVPKDSLFVLGDNRDSSLDSRFWGFVPLENLRGKAFIIYWSFDSQNSYPFYRLDKKIRFLRLGNLIR